MIKFEDMYGVVTLTIFPSNSELDLLKSLGVNTIWLMGTNYDLILRCRDRGINCIPYIGHTAFGDPLENVPCYIIVPDEPSMHGLTYEQVVQRAIEARKKTSKPIGFNFTWAGGIQRYFPGINDYVDFTSIDCYPYHGGFHEGDLTDTWAFIQANVRVPTYIVGQAFEYAEFSYPDIKRQIDFWRPKNVGLLWYAWAGGGGLIKTDKSIQEAIRITPYVPPPPPEERITTKAVTCSVCGASIVIEVSSIGRSVELFCPVCGNILPSGVGIRRYSPLPSHCSQCGSTLKIRVLLAEPMVDLHCPVCQAYAGKGYSIAVTNLEEMTAKVQGEIATLDERIAELQRQLEALRDEITRTKEIIGV